MVWKRHLDLEMVGGQSQQQHRVCLALNQVMGQCWVVHWCSGSLWPTETRISRVQKHLSLTLKRSQTQVSYI